VPAAMAGRAAVLEADRRALLPALGRSGAAAGERLSQGLDQLELANGARPPR